MLEPVATATLAAERHSQVTVAVRQAADIVVAQLVSALLPTDIDGSYAAAEPGAVAMLLSAYRRAAQESSRAGRAGVGAWTGLVETLSAVPALPDGLVPTPSDVASVLRQTVPVEAKYRIGSGATIPEALQHVRLRATRATANVGSDTARGAYTHVIGQAGMAWARTPSRTACPFCLLMAGRGPVYRSEQTAKGSHGYYHPWDRCLVLCVPRLADPDDYLSEGTLAIVGQADAAYRDAQADRRPGETAMAAYLRQTGADDPKV